MSRRAMRSALRSWSWMVPASPFCMKACPPIAISTSLRGCTGTAASDIERTRGIVQDRVPLRAKEDTMAKKAPDALAERQKPALPAAMYQDLLRKMLTVYYLEERLKVFVRAGKVS